ncbi:Transcriptional regulator, GntR family [Marinobacter nitratireducens]|uniref:Transcriptional regulator, GntR family n=1 Tax=Marinobacter nitratireducens TaxID=1137280 RepID=A0A072N6X3_9GAMM|nr:GntR family transcriptional regulator [Marinobacter nitratireducens]KEF32703.1 Transcriptional regulator, GntR family [Marinobacter nitratireducens]
MSRSQAVSESVADGQDQKRDSRPKSKGLDAIYRSISDAIIEHRLKPGARLREDALSDVFGVSRTGIRKVLQRLALEQLVTLTPRRGASVNRPSVEEAKDVFEARRMVECGLMEVAARRVTDADVKELRKMAQEEKQALRNREQRVAIKLSAAFHARLAELSGNKTLSEFVGQLCSRSSLILAVYGNSGHLGCESHDHENLVDYLCAGEGKKASSFMERHLKSIEASLSFVEESDETPDLRDIFSV